MKFRTQYDSHAPVYQEPGSPEKVVYSPRYSDSGVLDLEPTGKENIYDFIQSHKESTDIHVLLTRFANGEDDVLQRMQGFYADVSDMPKTYAEVLNAVISGEEAFSRLPVEVKQRFGNSFSVWMSSFDSPDFAEKMGFSKAADSSMSSQQVQDFAASSGSVPNSSQASVPSSDASSSSGG